MAKITGTMTFDNDSIPGAAIASSPVVDADKLQHVYKAGTNLGFAIGATPTTREEIIHVAEVAGTIRGFHCLLNDTGTSTDIDFDLKKNGVSVLTAVATITHSDADKAVVDGTLSSTTVAVDDVFSIAMTVTSSTGAQGPYAWVNIEENGA